MTATPPSARSRSQLENTPERYGSMARALHWSIALLFLASYAAVYTRHWFTEPKTPENWVALQTHLVVGVLIALLVVVRVVWRMRSPQPDDVPGTRLEHLASHTMHLVLYAVMIVMPISGYLGTGVATEVPFFGDIPSFKDTTLFQSLGASWEAFEKPVDFVHKNAGAYLVWVLVVLHAAAAFYHHFVRRDDVLRRMLRPKRGA